MKLFVSIVIGLFSSVVVSAQMHIYAGAGITRAKVSAELGVGYRHNQGTASVGFTAPADAGLPLIGAGLAGGDWTIIEKIIEEETRGEYVTIVRYVP